ncbi:hypothetical protein [uncultured Microscilla sp.]|uniref:hypothetical protein n=1 Tax=uncultured Microscilla sp. TaxID=432653 RepID=UPI00262675BC|nr:hypothetical protein [uncultured Microscilla sp.]
MVWIVVGSCILFGWWLIRQTRRQLFKSEGVTKNLLKHPAEFDKPEITYVQKLHKENPTEIQQNSKKKTK